MTRVIEKEFEISKLVRSMVFGRKKKKRNDKVKSEDKSNPPKDKTPKRRPSVVSTPVRSRKSAQNGKKSSVRRNSIKRGRPVVTKRCNGTIPKRQRRPDAKSSSSEERLGPQGAPAEEKCENSPRQRARIPTPPPPPPPLSESKRRALLRSSDRDQNKDQNQYKKRQIADKTPQGGIIHSLTPPPQQEHITQEPEIIREANSQRMRTPEDLRKWREWRVSINDQLVTYTMSEKQNTQPQASPVTAFPEEFTEDTISAILNHSAKVEKPRSTLDKLSYMIYGIPRVNLSNHDRYEHKIAKDRLSDIENNNFILQQQKSENKLSHQIRPSQKTKSSENLFIQTNPSSNIHRYLPSKALKPEIKHQHKKPRAHLEPRQTVDQTRPVDYTERPVLYPRFAAPAPNHALQQGARLKPPIPGAVPTILSGLQPYDMGRLRHVSRGSRKSSKASNNR